MKKYSQQELTTAIIAIMKELNLATNKKGYGTKDLMFVLGAVGLEIEHLEKES